MADFAILIGGRARGEGGLGGGWGGAVTVGGGGAGGGGQEQNYSTCTIYADAQYFKEGL